MGRMKELAMEEEERYGSIRQREAEALLDEAEYDAYMMNEANRKISEILDQPIYFEEEFFINNTIAL